MSMARLSASTVDKRKRRKAEIDGEDARDDFGHREAAVGGALIVMGAVRLPDLLAARQPTDQGERGVGQIVQRQQQRGGQVAGAGEKDQEPADQEADRQTADIAEKKPGGRPIEIGKSEHGAAERQRHGDAVARQRAQTSKQPPVRR